MAASDVWTGTHFSWARSVFVHPGGVKLICQAPHCRFVLFFSTVSQRGAVVRSPVTPSLCRPVGIVRPSAGLTGAPCRVVALSSSHLVFRSPSGLVAQCCSLMLSRRSHNDSSCKPHVRVSTRGFSLVCFGRHGRFQDR